MDDARLPQKVDRVSVRGGGSEWSGPHNFFFFLSFLHFRSFVIKNFSTSISCYSLFSPSFGEQAPSLPRTPCPHKAYLRNRASIFRRYCDEIYPRPTLRPGKHELFGVFPPSYGLQGFYRKGVLQCYVVYYPTYSPLPLTEPQHYRDDHGPRRFVRFPGYAVAFCGPPAFTCPGGTHGTRTCPTCRCRRRRSAVYYYGIHARGDQGGHLWRRTAGSSHFDAP